MPAPDLTDEEHAAVVAALRKLIEADKFPYSPRLKPFKSALAKFDPKLAKVRTVARSVLPQFEIRGFFERVGG